VQPLRADGAKARQVLARPALRGDHTGMRASCAMSSSSRARGLFSGMLTP
jgi:hypothetical protein